jgi:hypothetical protein
MGQKSIENQPLRQEPQIRSQDNLKGKCLQYTRARSQSSNHRYAKASRPALNQTGRMLKKVAVQATLAAIALLRFPALAGSAILLSKSRWAPNSAQSSGSAKHLAVTLALD